MSFNPQYRLQNLAVTGNTILNNLTVTGSFTGTLSGISLTGTTVLQNATVQTLTGTTANFTTSNVGTQNATTLNVSGNMSGANAYLQNLAVNNGIASSSATIGYNGLTVVGLNGTQSLKTLAGDTVIGTNMPSNLLVSGNVVATGSISAAGNLTAGGNLTVGGTTTLGTLSLTNVTATNVTATNATATNATIGNLTATTETVGVLTGTVANIATSNVGTETVQILNVKNYASGANASWENMAINSGFSCAGPAVIGYNGMQVIGLNGTTSLNVLAGNVIFGSDLPSNVAVSGNLQVTGTATISGATTLAGLTATSINDTGALTVGGATTVKALAAASINCTGTSTLAGVSATTINASGSVLAALVGATTGTFTQLNCTGQLSLATGANAIVGILPLSGGTGAIASTSVSANDLVMLTRQTLGSVSTNAGFVGYTINPGVQVDVVSSNALDDGLINYLIIRRQ